MKRIGVILILVLAFAGLSDSAYLTQHELSGTPLICNIQNLSGCNIVASSSYSHLFGIPLAEYGLVFYAILFILAALEIVLFDQFLRRFIQAVAVFGALSSIYFTSIQIYFIGAFCIYCLASALITVLVLALASMIEPLRTREVAIPVAPPAPPFLSMPPEA